MVPRHSPFFRGLNSLHARLVPHFHGGMSPSHPAPERAVPEVPGAAGRGQVPLGRGGLRRSSVWLTCFVGVAAAHRRLRGRGRGRSRLADPSPGPHRPDDCGAVGRRQHRRPRRRERPVATDGFATRASALVGRGAESRHAPRGGRRGCGNGLDDGGSWPDWPVPGIPAGWGAVAVVATVRCRQRIRGRDRVAGLRSAAVAAPPRSAGRHRVGRGDLGGLASADVPRALLVPILRPRHAGGLVHRAPQRSRRPRVAVQPQRRQHHVGGAMARRVQPHIRHGGRAGSLGAASTVVVILGATALVITELVRTRLGHPSVLLPDAPRLRSLMSPEGRDP